MNKILEAYKKKHKFVAVPDKEDDNDAVDAAVGEEKKDPCWKGYKQLGMKKKGDKQVPNCVPESVEELDEKVQHKMVVGQKVVHAKHGEGTIKDIVADPDGGKQQMFSVKFKNGKSQLHYGEELKIKSIAGDLDEAIKPYVSGDHASGWTVLDSKGKEVKTFHHKDYASDPIKDKKAAAKADAMDYLKKNFSKLSEESVEEAKNDSIGKKFNKMLSWGKSKPSDVMKRHANYTDDELKSLKKTVNKDSPDGSVRAFQNKVIDREMKRRGVSEESVEEAIQPSGLTVKYKKNGDGSFNAIIHNADGSVKKVHTNANQMILKKLVKDRYGITEGFVPFGKPGPDSSHLKKPSTSGLSSTMDRLKQQKKDAAMTPAERMQKIKDKLATLRKNENYIQEIKDRVIALRKNENHLPVGTELKCGKEKLTVKKQVGKDGYVVKADESIKEPETTKDKTDVKLPPPVKGGKLHGEIPAGFKPNGKKMHGSM